jgi:sortase A
MTDERDEAVEPTAAGAPGEAGEAVDAAEAGGNDGGEVEAPDAPANSGARLRRRRGRGRLIGFCIALALLLTGAGLLAYVGWEYWGTDYVAKKEQAKIKEDLRDRWQHPTVADVIGPEAAAPAVGSAQALVRIPRFGTSYEVPLIEGVRDEDLSRGIGHFPGTGPGQIGNFALAGHRVTHGEPFRGMPDLRPGDEVIVETSDATYTYQLDTDPNDLIIPFTQGWVIDPVPVPPEGEAPPGMPSLPSTRPREALITLTTCSELFHTDNRMVAFGHLVTTTPKSP